MVTAINELSDKELVQLYNQYKDWKCNKPMGDLLMSFVAPISKKGFANDGYRYAVDIIEAELFSEIANRFSVRVENK